MRAFLTITKALNDQTRLRTLLVLQHDELCLCQLVELFGLAPSTISKHLNVLYNAGLIDRRREGRWAYFRLAEHDRSRAVEQAIGWVTDCLGDESQVAHDREKLDRVLEKDLHELCECYT